jgi:hypothetical protein
MVAPPQRAGNHPDLSSTPTADAVVRWLNAPTAEAADRWVRGLGAPMPPCPHAHGAALTAWQRRALALAPDVCTGLSGELPAAERWRRFRARPDAVRRAEGSNRTPQPVTIAAAIPEVGTLRLTYHLVVVDREVTLVPRNVAVPGLYTRILGAHEPYDPASIRPPHSSVPRQGGGRNTGQAANAARNRRWREARRLIGAPAGPAIKRVPDVALVYEIVWDTLQHLQAAYDDRPGA